MTAPPPPRRLGYRPELDGLRAVAVLLVLGAHMRTLLPDVEAVRLNSGFFGVDIFFVLSGFLITTLFLEERAHRGDVSLRGFFGRRVLRLFPALLFGIAVAGVAASLLGRNGPGMPVHEAALWTLLLVANWSSESLGLLAHMWSLGVEQQFYILWPFVLLACLVLNLRLRALAVVLLVLSIAIATARAAVLHGAGYHGLVWGALRADAILLGSALGALLLTDTGGRIRRALRDRRVVAAGAVITIGYLLYAEVSGRLGKAAFTKDFLIVGTLGFTVLLGSLVSVPVAPRWLAAKPTVALGRLSYAIYLVHYPVFGVLAWIGPTNPWFAIPVALTITFALAMVAHHLIEQPALRLKRLFDSERVGRRGDAGLEVERSRREEELVRPVGGAVGR